LIIKGVKNFLGWLSFPMGEGALKLAWKMLLAFANDTFFQLEKDTDT
jgi:hypothetical protein